MREYKENLMFYFCVAALDILVIVEFCDFPDLHITFAVKKELATEW